MFVDICSSILTAMSAVVLLQYTLTCFYCSLHCMLSCYCFDPSVDIHVLHAYCTEASAALVLHCGSNLAEKLSGLISCTTAL